MKSRIHKGMKVSSEIKPAIGVLHPDFVYQRNSDLRVKFAEIRERQAKELAENHTVIQLKARKAK